MDYLTEDIYVYNSILIGLVNNACEQLSIAVVLTSNHAILYLW